MDYLGPRIAVLRLLRRIGGEGHAQQIFFGGLLGHERFVLQAGLIAADSLERILHAEKIFVRDFVVFPGFGAELLQHRIAASERLENQGIGHVAEQVELRHGVQPARGSGIAGNKNEVAVLDAGGGPFEVVVEMRGLIVLVDAEEADVQIVAGILKIVGVAAEKGGIEFGREDQTHIGVLLIFVKVVHRAGVERDHVATLLGLGGTLLFDGGHLGALRLRLIGHGHSGFRSGVYLGGDVFDTFQNVQLEIGAFGLFGLRLGVEAGLQEILAAGGKLLDALGAHVMIGESESVSGNERARAAVIEAHGGEPGMVKPGRREIELVLGLELRRGREIVKPHTLVRRRDSRDK